MSERIYPSTALIFELHGTKAHPLLGSFVQALVSSYVGEIHLVEGTRPPSATEEKVYLTLCREKGGNGANAVIIGEGDLAFPFRPGRLLRKLRRMSAAEENGGRLTVGPFVLIAAEGVLIQADSALSIRLTDKERDILLALARAPERRLDRKVLLETVWGYVEGIETHTLETHIYRLRQKIEPDPTAPRILTTEGQGYGLL